jgi:hypothetical protein
MLLTIAPWQLYIRRVPERKDKRDNQAVTLLRRKYTRYKCAVIRKTTRHTGLARGFLAPLGA